MELAHVEQGHVLRIPILPIIDREPSSSEACIAELDTPTGLAIVVTQTCDAVREPNIEPYLHVAPVKDETEDVWQRSRWGRLSPRYFALPCDFEGVSHPVVDIRLLTSVDKRLILDDSLVIAARLPEACRRPFAEWLGRRFARYAFPDDLERDLLRHLRQRVYVRYDSNQADGPLVRHIVGLFVNQMDRTVRLLLLVEPGARTIPQLNDEQKVQQAVRQLFGPIYTRARHNGWQLDAVVHEPSELNAFDLLYGYQQVELDFPQGQVSD